jgi:tryptophan synthase alpha chain
MSTRIVQAFERAAKAKRAAFIPFITAGDPTPAQTVALARALERAGADILELGVPFTDPIADGPTIQRAAERALAGGTTLSTVLQLVRDLRYSSELPVVLFSYFNPLHAYGLARFAVDAAAAGVDGVLLTDVPVDEAAPVADQLRRVGIDLVLLVAPTSTRERVRAVRRLASGFVYFVARTGVTGARRFLPEGLEEQVKTVRKLAKSKVVVGFGVSTPEQVASVSQYADGVVVGSALVERIAELGQSGSLVEDVGAYARSLAIATQRQ